MQLIFQKDIKEPLKPVKKPMNTGVHHKDLVKWEKPKAPKDWQVACLLVM